MSATRSPCGPARFSLAALGNPAARAYGTGNWGAGSRFISKERLPTCAGKAASMGRRATSGAASGHLASGLINGGPIYTPGATGTKYPSSLTASASADGLEYVNDVPRCNRVSLSFEQNKGDGCRWIVNLGH